MHCRAYNIAGRAREVIQANVKALEKRHFSAATSWYGSLPSLLSSSPAVVLDPKDEAKVCDEQPDQSQKILHAVISDLHTAPGGGSCCCLASSQLMFAMFARFELGLSSSYF